MYEVVEYSNTSSVFLNGAGLDMTPDPLPDVVSVNQALSEPLGFEQVYPHSTYRRK